MATSDKKEITITTQVTANIGKVWEYWTQPEHIVKWNTASEDWHTPNATNDLRPDGKFSYRMEAKDGSFGFDFEGVYSTVIPNEKIEYEIADGRKVQIDFHVKDNHVQVTETFEAENQNAIEMQQNGWQAILDNFKKHVESN